MAEFLNMGGYASFVWPSFGITFLVLWANVWFAKNQFKRVTRETARRSAMTRAKKQARAS